MYGADTYATIEYASTFFEVVSDENCSPYCTGSEIYTEGTSIFSRRASIVTALPDCC